MKMPQDSKPNPGAFVMSNLYCFVLVSPWVLSPVPPPPAPAPPPVPVLGDEVVAFEPPVSDGVDGSVVVGLEDDASTLELLLELLELLELELELEEELDELSATACLVVGP